MLTGLKRPFYVLLAVLCFVVLLAAQVPTTAVPVTLTVVSTLKGVTTWSFTDSAGKLFYLQAPAYFTLQEPLGATVVAPVRAPGLWSSTAVVSPPQPTQSPDLTTIFSDDGKSITDAVGQVWTVVKGVVLMNGVPIGFSSGVAKLEIVKGVLWQENTVNNWYYWSVADKTWNGGAAPV